MVMGRFNNLRWDLHRSMTELARKMKTPTQAERVGGGGYALDEEMVGCLDPVSAANLQKPQP